MGVRGLWKLLGGTEVHNTELRGKKLSVDGNIILYSCIMGKRRGNPQMIVEYTMEKVFELLALEIDPIFVFDGRAPMHKRAKLGRDRAPPVDMLDSGPECAGMGEVVAKKLDLWGDFYDETNYKAPRGKEEPAGDGPAPPYDENFCLAQIEKVRRSFMRRQMHSDLIVHGDCSLTYALEATGERGGGQAQSQRKRVGAGAPEYRKLDMEIRNLKRAVEQSVVYKHMADVRAVEEVAPKEEGEKGALDDDAAGPGEESEFSREMRMYEADDPDKPLLLEQEDGVSSMAYKTILEVLDLLRIKYAISPAESDSLHRNIGRAMRTDGVISNDSDVLLYGNSVVYRDFFSGKAPTTMHVMGERYSWKELTVLAWLLGCDYAKGVRGVGRVKAARIVEEYRAPGGELGEMERLGQSIRPFIGEAELEAKLEELRKLRKIYLGTSFRAEIKNAGPAEIDIKKAAGFVKGRVKWKDSEVIAFLEHVNRRRRERAHCP